jgi:hypothetical protein
MDFTPSLADLLDVTTFKDLIVTGTLTVRGSSEFFGQALFRAPVKFADDVELSKRVKFLEHPVLSKDSAGYAVIQQGANMVRVAFQQPYPFAPIVVVNPDVRVPFAVKEVTASGFIIELTNPAEQDIHFTWSATAVDEPATFVSTPPPSPLPTATPVQTPLPTSTPSVSVVPTVSPTESPGPTIVSPQPTTQPTATPEVSPSP